MSEFATRGSMNIWGILQHAVAHYPDKIALKHISEGMDVKAEIDDGYTYSQVSRRISSLANFLRSNGLRWGDRISLLADNAIPVYETFFATTGMGAILNPLDIECDTDDLINILKDAEPRWLITSSKFGAIVEEFIYQNSKLEGILWIDEPSDLPTHIPGYSYETAMAFEPVFEVEFTGPEQKAMLVYSKGKYGDYRGALLTHRNICLHAYTTVSELRISEEDRWMHYLAMTDILDWWAIFAVTLAGGEHIVSAGIDQELLPELLEYQVVTLTSFTPRILEMLALKLKNEESDISNLRTILTGKYRLPVETVDAITSQSTCELLNTYSISETCSFVTLSFLNGKVLALPEEEQNDYRASAGKPIPGVDIVIVRQDGTRVEMDGTEVGELWVRGDVVSPGYWNNPGLNKKVFQDGWLKTGDLATINEDGYIKIIGRM